MPLIRSWLAQLQRLDPKCPLTPFSSSDVHPEWLPALLTKHNPMGPTYYPRSWLQAPNQRAHPNYHSPHKAGQAQPEAAYRIDIVMQAGIAAAPVLCTKHIRRSNSRGGTSPQPAASTRTSGPASNALGTLGGCSCLVQQQQRQHQQH